MSEAIRLRYVGEIGALIKQIEGADGATRTLTKDLAAATTSLRTYDRAQAALAGTASKAVVPSLGATTAAAGNLQAQLFDIGVGLQGGQNPLTILTQQGPQVLQALTGAGGGAEALKMALVRTAAVVGPLALTIGVAVAAWKSYTEEEERAARISVEVRDAIDATRGMLDRAAEATLAYDVATGALTETQGKLIASNRTLFAQYAASTAETTSKISALKQEQAGLVTQLVDVAEGFYSLLPTGRPMLALLDGLTTSSSEYQQEIDALSGAQTVAIERLEAAKVATEKQIIAEAARKKGLGELSSAIKDAAKEDAIWASLRGELDAWDREQATARVDAAWAAAEDEVKRGDMLTAKAIADTRLIAEAEAAGARRAEATARASAQAISDVFAVGAEGAAFLAEQVAKEGIGSGKVLFGVSKALGIANATINTYQAATLALATIPPPFGAIAAGAAVASGLLSVGKITAVEPQYHRGRATDEIPATILRSERVLTATGARVVGGDRAVADANRGNAPQQTVTAAFVLGHQVYDRQTRTALRVPGSSLASALTRGRHVGHR